MENVPFHLLDYLAIVILILVFKIKNEKMLVLKNDCEMINLLFYNNLSCWDKKSFI